jgi:hypothetical protein
VGGDKIQTSLLAWKWALLSSVWTLLQTLSKARKAERNSLGVSLQNGGRRDHEGGLGSARGDRIPVPKTPWLILSQVYVISGPWMKAVSLQDGMQTLQLHIMMSSCFQLQLLELAYGQCCQQDPQSAGQMWSP